MTVFDVPLHVVGEYLAAYQAQFGQMLSASDDVVKGGGALN